MPVPNDVRKQKRLHSSKMQRTVSIRSLGFAIFGCMRVGARGGSDKWDEREKFHAEARSKLLWAAMKNEEIRMKVACRVSFVACHR